MSGLKEIRNRISSVSSTMQITNAMKMVSAAKLKKAQDSITATLPYSNKLSELIKSISASVDSTEPNPLFEKRELKKPLLVVITSNKGLCGGFNSNIIKEVYSLASEYGPISPDLLTIGKKGNDILRKKFNVINSHKEVYDSFSYSSVKEIAENITQRFEGEEYDEIVLVYNHFKNAATQIITKEQYLPIHDDSDDKGNVSGDYIFEPNRAKILEELIPKSLAIQLFKAISDSIAGEHGARMTAMHKATDNATDLRDQLKLTYNKARQTAITNEILEIVGGAEALNS
ncbi:MAG: ATP synthase F1 subunit gamma [Cryomorphaceae bacterium]|jgi:F-type H+-transporting ATPase subunit gamma|nr:ATP synthase F1 subunit gamma [Cryomorphaceae bacterium]MBT4518301.1 ATP synthase F1 subunit gamma [Cryomorphaceae bacterium]MBT6214335.1 ATP synthase F1 subunit gamma [Cryomorphaceae bacterium]MBT6736029.1 ATP synthase F1 subunit gamma [Cryomorphaceae bacterium]MBT6935358.1 ATP synthase F1 subunit gamma [Cryomorphaceae bacterium]